MEVKSVREEKQYKASINIQSFSQCQKMNEKGRRTMQNEADRAGKAARLWRAEADTLHRKAALGSPARPAPGA